MQFLRCPLVLASFLVAFSGVDATTFLKTARGLLRKAANERVELISQSLFTVENILKLPAHVTKEQEANVLTSLEKQVEKLEGNVAKISEMDKKEHSADAEKKNQELKDHMKDADKAMLDKMDEWGKRMNRKTRLGAMDVISKLKNAIHLVKKGALTGNKEASESLNKVLEKMGTMAGTAKPAGGNFLH
mmetsp:Transcript_42320/g.67023  ORF Transcript_42320/g.67023 Transcript_42320/m.67023 type:complete len:189 (-) Transcript_42320:47-613(-)|eukprot:CAMPEP_0169119254 /NCGR_PEP_ID=MMETSP1015-20121227/31449_1 /TAXON_ID=342587 /ORGANISM="Karlodinium micrum, Strain CCMP2283" /LENGTH=188 /DNA_ID=CAMNT_0009182103 /DNA_START=152 /DNA_END=718 /DNA_ORIENTATION=-